MCALHRCQTTTTCIWFFTICRDWSCFSSIMSWCCLMKFSRQQTCRQHLSRNINPCNTMLPPVRRTPLQHSQGDRTLLCTCSCKSLWRDFSNRVWRSSKAFSSHSPSSLKQFYIFRWMRRRKKTQRSCLRSSALSLLIRWLKRSLVGVNAIVSRKPSPLVAKIAPPKMNINKAKTNSSDLREFFNLWEPESPLFQASL